MIARLAAEPAERCARVSVVLERPPVQLRVLRDLPPVRVNWHQGTSKPLQECGLRREQVLIDVVAAPCARAQEKVAPQHRRCHQIAPKGFVRLAHTPPRVG